MIFIIIKLLFNIFHITLCSAAAVASDFIEAPIKTPCCQFLASYTRGTPSGLRPPKRIASIGTPFGSSQAGSIIGHCPAGEQNLEFGCAASDLDPLIHFLPCQSVIYINVVIYCDSTNSINEI